MKYILILSAILFFAVPAFAAFPVSHPAAAQKETARQQSSSEKMQSTLTHAQKTVPGGRAVGRGFGFGFVALVFGILGLFFFHLAFGIIAVIIGAIGMKRHPLRRPFALAGFILGIIDILLIL